MSQKFEPDFDAMTDDELDEYLQSWKEAEPDLFKMIEIETNRTKALMVNPAKVNVVNHFLECLACFMSEHETKKHESIEIRNKEIDITNTLVIDLKFFNFNTFDEPVLKRMLSEMVACSDGVQILPLRNDFVGLSFYFKDYVIEIPGPVK